MATRVTYMFDEQKIASLDPKFRLGDKQRGIDNIRFVANLLSDRFAQTAGFNGFESSGAIFGLGFFIVAEHPELLPEVFPAKQAWVKRVSENC